MTMHYNHGEAFMLMKYVGDRSGRVEWLWNSRDGVTPFGILPQGMEAPQIIGRCEMFQHTDWAGDVRIPRFVPPVGMRIFIGHTRETARAAAERFYEKVGRQMIADNPHLKAIGEAELMRRKIEDIYKDGEGPNIVTVDAALYEHFQRKAQA